MSASPARARAELLLALSLVLVGSGLAYLVAGRQWVDVRLPARPPLPGGERSLTGAQVVGSLRPLAFVALAGVAALAATKGRGRIVLGVVLVLSGAGMAAATLTALSSGVFHALERHPQVGALDLTGPEPSFRLWWLLALLAAALVAAGGAVVAVRGRGWAALSSRYDTPAARADKPPPRPDVAAWDALDRGEDPTSGVGLPDEGTSTTESTRESTPRSAAPTPATPPRPPRLDR